MQTLTVIFLLIGAYLLGSIPSGLIIVKLGTGKDVRHVGSGRTGGTNVMRAAGLVAGLLTALADFGKSYLAVYLTRWLLPDLYWVHAVAGLLSILGHNHSIYLPERKPDGRWHLRGGAGGVCTVGAAFGLWQPSLLIILPLAALVFVFVGYASVTTISAAAASLLIFGYRALTGVDPWEYAAYGAFAVVLVLIALRPNLKRLREGNERLVGLRVYLKKRAERKRNQTQ